MNRYTYIIAVFCVLVICTFEAIAMANWDTPQVLWEAAWDDPTNLDIDDSGSRLVTLIPSSGPDDNSRNLMVTEKVNGTWQTPVVLASNGVYSFEIFQWMPKHTVPVISGDGETIAYLGYTGTDYMIYISDRPGAAANWSEPEVLATGLASHYYAISLSADGNTLALSNYPSIGQGFQHVYVMTRNKDGIWGQAVQVSSDTGDIGGSFPSLADDGNHLVWIGNGRVVYSERRGGIWSTPQSLTSNTWGNSKSIIRK